MVGFRAFLATGFFSARLRTREFLVFFHRRKCPACSSPKIGAECGRRPLRQPLIYVNRSTFEGVPAAHGPE